MRGQQTSGRMFILMIVIIYTLAYFFRWFYLNHYLRQGTYLIDVNPDWNRLTLTAFNQSFLISSLLFGLFFLVSGKVDVSGRQAITRTDYRLPSGLSIIFFGLLIVASLILRMAYGSVLGEEAASIPYHLGTPLYRAQTDLIPGLFLLLAEAAWYVKSRPGYTVALTGLALFHLAMALITTSKAGLIYFGVEFLMLMYLTGQNIFARPIRLFLIGAAGLAVFIIAAQLRSKALSGTDTLLVVSIEQGRVLDTVLEVIGLIANRLPGTEGLALYCGYNCHNLPRFSMPALNGFAQTFYTQVVIAVPRDFDFRSPGYSGGWIIASGLWGGILFGVAFLRVWLAGFRFADRQGISAAAKIVMCIGLFRFILEGTLSWQDLASPLAAACLVEWMSRSIIARPSPAAQETYPLSA